MDPDEARLGTAPETGAGPEPQPVDGAQVEAVIALVRRVLGSVVTAAYHYGSAVAGGLRPASDLDVFVITERALTDVERDRLAEGLLDISAPPGSPDGRPVEVTIVELRAVVPWPTEPVRQFQFGEWLRADFEAGFRSPPVVDPDLAPLVATVLEASRPAIGPAAADLLDPVPPDRLVAAMRAGIDGLLDELEDDTTNVLLTLARMLYTVEFGAITSKDLAADHVLRALSGAGRPGQVELDQLDRARLVYLSGEAAVPGSYEPEAVRAVATDLADRIVAGS